jgi:hypothetical protein
VLRYVGNTNSSGTGSCVVVRKPDATIVPGSRGEPIHAATTPGLLAEPMQHRQLQYVYQSRVCVSGV